MTSHHVFAALSLSTSGPINLDVSVSGNSANVATDNLTVISTCPSGYTLSIQGPSDTTLYKNGDKITNSANSNAKILPSNGTFSDPLPIIGEDGNNNSYLGTWGYNTTTAANALTSTDNFIGLTNTLTAFYNSTTGTQGAGSGANNDAVTIPVYYGVSITPSIEPGTYTMAESSPGANDNTITYYLTPSINCTSYTIKYNPESIADDGSGGTVTLSGTGTMDDQIVAVNTTTNLSPNAFTPPTGYYFAGWNTKNDGTGTSYTNGQSINDIASAGDTVTLYAMWVDCPSNSICYNDNGANSPTTMAPQPINNPATATSIFLWASNYQYANHGFAGWNTESDGTGKSYGPNEDISFIAGQYNAKGLKLYAMWIESKGDLQNWNGCSAMNIGDVTALTDIRDNNTYAVAKLADGKCWMIENLRLDNTATLNTSNTNNPASNFTLSASQDPTTTAWCFEESAACVDQSVVFASSANPVSEMSVENGGGDANIYSYGNYYNWYSATAGRGTYSTNSSNVSGSVCPSGWGLPIGADYDDLNEDINSNSTNSDFGFRSHPNNFVYSGYVLYNSAYQRNSNGSYASSSAMSFQARAYSLSFSTNYVSPGNSGGKYDGLTIRCVAGN